MSAPAATTINYRTADGSTMLSIVGTISGLLRSIASVAIAVITPPLRLRKQLLP